MKVALDLHDFSVVNNRLDLLLKVKEHFPSFKVSLFTVPIDKEEDWGPSLLRRDFLSEIKRHTDWMQFIPHGLRHERSEALMWDYSHMKGYVISEIEQRFKDDGLSFERGFCAPHWRWSGGVVEALDKSGWWGAIDRDKKMRRPQRFYQYNYLLNEPFGNEEILKIHGHIYGTRNDLGRCMDNLLSLPKDAEWHFVTDFIDETI